MNEKIDSKSLPSGSILFSSSASLITISVVGYELLYKSRFKDDIPSHCEVYFKDIGVISASFPIVSIKKLGDNYLYALVNPQLKGKKLKYFKETLLRRVGSPYDVISLLKFIPNLKKELEKIPILSKGIGYNCVTLFRDLVPFEVEGLTVVDFMNKLTEHGWKKYNFIPQP